MIAIFKETLTVLFQCLDTGRKYRNKSSKSKTAAATDAPSEIPGIIVTAESSPGEIELDAIKLVSVTRTP